MTTKNIYSHNVCIMGFMKILSMKRGYESIFRFVSILFKGDYKRNYLLVLKGVMVMFVGMSKNFGGL